MNNRFFALKEWFVVAVLNILPCVPVVFVFEGDKGKADIHMSKMYLRSGFKRFTSRDRIVVNWDTKEVSIRVYE